MLLQASYFRIMHILNNNLRTNNSNTFYFMNMLRHFIPDYTYETLFYIFFLKSEVTKKSFYKVIQRQIR